MPSFFARIISQKTLYTSLFLLFVNRLSKLEYCIAKARRVVVCWMLKDVLIYITYMD